MNQERRKAIQAVISELSELQSKAAALAETVSELADAERDYFDNMPESIQAGEKGERASESADQLDNAKDSLENLDSEFNEIESALSQAMES